MKYYETRTGKTINKEEKQITTKDSARKKLIYQSTAMASSIP